VRLLEKIYRSKFGILMSIVANRLSILHKPFMVYVFRDPATGEFRKFTRLSSNLVILSKSNLSIGDHVWVWHHSILDATEGVAIGEGCQIGAWVGIFTHGSENSIRLLGDQFVHIPNQEREGDSRGPVSIGDYSFVGAGTRILPGVSIGRGCLIGAGSLITKDIPDYSIAVGQPAEVKGSTIDIDQKFFKETDFSATYYDKHALDMIIPHIESQQEE